MGDKKTRVVVDSEGRDYELFSIRENNAGELYIFFKPHKLTAPLGVYEVSRRISVHASPDSKDGSFLVKTTVRDSEGKDEEIYASILPSATAHSMVICSHAVHSFTDSDLCTAKQGDPRVQLCRHLSTGTFFYSIVVSRHGISEQDFYELGLSVTRMQFQTIELFVLSGLFRTGATNSSAKFYKMSQPSIYDGEKDFWIKPSGWLERAQSPEPHEIAHLIGADIELMSEHLGANLEGFTYPDGKPLSASEIEEKRRGYQIYWEGPELRTMTDVPTMRLVQQMNRPAGMWFPPEGSPGIKIGRRRRR